MVNAQDPDERLNRLTSTARFTCTLHRTGRSGVVISGGGMIEDALFWLGLAAASGAGLLISLSSTASTAQELNALQADAVTAADRSSVSDRAQCGSRIATSAYQQELVSLACTAQRAERDAVGARSHHQSQMKWAEESRATLRLNWRSSARNYWPHPVRHWKTRTKKPRQLTQATRGKN